ncbi:nitrate- and nitrite sensing domain-containing protein [Achromobacter xylosoxidans]
MSEHAMPSTLRFLLAARRSELHGLEALAATCELTTLVSKLVHVLQKERGSSNLYLCGGQDALRQTLAGLSSDACAVEEEVRRFLDRLEPDATRSAGKARLLNCIAYALYRLDELPRTRRAIRDRRVAAEDAGAVFTRLIASLFALVFEAADSSLDAGVTRLLVALLNFMQGKELCGQERAYGVMGYTAGYFTESQKARLLELADLQKRCFDSFAQYAGADALAAWERLEQGGGPVLRLRDMALRTSEAERVDAGLAELWFGLCTERIDAMRAVESLLAEALTLQCHRRIVETRAELDNHRLLLSRFADHASDAAPAMLFQLQGRILDVPPQDGVGEAMERSILDLMREQAQRLRQSDDALALARGALEERRRVERAKWLLVSRHGLSEQAAHDQLQCVAMDRRRSLDDVARQVLAELDEAQG